MTAASAAPLTVSVVLCTHNGAAFIAEQLASILAQRPAPIEIVLGDDDSRDGTVDIVERLVADARATDPDTAPELVVRRHSPALGVTANFADAIAHARGELIALSDQDDIWMPDKLAVVVDRFAHDSRLTLVHSDARLIDGASSPLGGTLLEALEITTQEQFEDACDDPDLVKNETVFTLVFPKDPPGCDWGEDDNEDAAPDLQQDPCPENKNDQTQERNEYAVKVLAQVDQKLRGSIGNAGEAISVEDQVARVIEVATDTTRLCQMYEGWSAWI